MNEISDLTQDPGGPDPSSQCEHGEETVFHELGFSPFTLTMSRIGSRNSHF